MFKSYLTIKISVFILIIFSFSCSKKKPQLTIDEEKLIQVFFDMHAADYIINRAPTNEKDSLSNVYQDQIFKIHHIDRNEFQENLKILESHPRYFKEFYEKLNIYADSLLKHHNIQTKKEKK